MEIIDKIFQIKYDIVFIALNFLDKDENYFSGGAEIHLKNICNVLKKTKKILVIQMTKSKDRIIEKDGISILLIKSYCFTHFKLRIRFLLNIIKTKFIHFNYLGLEKFIQKRKSIIYSATFHGIGWDFPCNNFPEPYLENNLKTIIGAKVIRWRMIHGQNNAIKKLDKVLSVDTSLTRYCQQFLPLYSYKIHTVFNFVDLQKFLPDTKNDRHLENKFRILFPRNISFARGMHLLVPVAKKLKNFNIPFIIQVAGKGIEAVGDKYEKILYREIKNNNLRDNFEFLSRVPHDNMPEVFRNCDLVIIPSLFSEGTSFSCLEAMACKKIVLATNVGGLNDLIFDGYNGYISNPNVDELASKIKYIYENIDKLEYIKENAYEMVSRVYSYEIWRNKIIDYFLVVD